MQNKVTRMMMAPDADPWGNGKFMDIEEASNGKIKDLAMDCKVEEPKFENGEAVEVRWSVTDDWTPRQVHRHER